MKKIYTMVFVFILILSVALFVISKGKVVEVEVAVVKRGNIAEYIEELGHVVLENKVSIFASAAGKVSEVTVEEGHKVEEGDALVKIDTKQLMQQIKILEAKKSAVIAQYNEALQPADKRVIEKLELRQTTQEKIVQEAARKRDSNKMLYEKGSISFEEYRTSILVAESEEARLDEINLDLEILKKPTSQNIITQYEAQIRQLDIQIDELRNCERDFLIVTPMKGTVMRKDVDVGRYLQPGTYVMEIGDEKSLYIETDVLVDEIGKVRIGAAVKISHKNLGIDEINGVIRKIHPRAFSKTSDLGIEQKRITVEIDIADAAELRPGYDMDIKIITNSKGNVLLISKNAVFEQNGRDYVFVNDKNTAVLREIQKGIESKSLIEVITGLQEGEEVILSPDEKLNEGVVIKTYKE